MKCHEVRKYLYAFTDGELEVKDNLEVLAHLNMCPECARRADVEQQLKKRIAEVFAQERAPETLVDGIREHLRPRGRRRKGGASLIIRLAPVVAAAAVIGIASIVWTGLRPDNRSSARGVVLDNPTQMVAAAELPRCFEAGHLQCSSKGFGHHLAGLSRDLDVVSADLSAQLGYRVLAPDWTAQKLQFVSACRCGMPGGMTGAHLVYDRYTHVEPVSLYSVHKGGPFEAFEERVIGDKVYLVSRAGDQNIIAWHGLDADYVFCSLGEPQEVPSLVSELVGPIRVALLAQDEAVLAAAQVERRRQASAWEGLDTALALVRVPRLLFAGRGDR